MVRLTQSSQSPPCPFYRQGNRGPERRRDLLKFIRSAGGFEARASVSRLSKRLRSERSKSRISGARKLMGPL